MSRWLLLLVLLAGPARADECALLWDMALVARALAEEQIPQPKIVSTLTRIYDGPAEVMESVAGLAVSSPLSAMLFARAVRNRCNAFNPKPRPAPLST